MKKHLLYGLVLFAAMFTSFGQSSRFGIKIGANYSTINSDTLDELGLDESRIGALVGFFADYEINSRFRIQPELQYSAQGNKEKEVRINYLQLPVALKYEISDVFNIHIGPQAGLKIWEWEDNSDSEADFAPIDFSGFGGIGVQITENFFAEARYVIGFSNVFDDPDDLLDLDGNNTVIQFALGYRL